MKLFLVGRLFCNPWARRDKRVKLRMKVKGCFIGGTCLKTFYHAEWPEQGIRRLLAKMIKGAFFRSIGPSNWGAYAFKRNLVPTVQ